MLNVWMSRQFSRVRNAQIRNAQIRGLAPPPPFPPG
jgi:hypothetical protein